MNKLYSLILSFAAVILSLDQWSKAAIQNVLKNEGDSFSFLSWFDFTLVYNPAAAFGLFRGLPENIRNWFFYLLTPIVLFFIWWTYVKKMEARERLMPICMGLILGGALGNYLDRFIYGKVVDFVDWHYATSSGKCIPAFYHRAEGTCHWPAFNIADSAICVAVTLLVGTQLWEGYQEYKNQKASK